MKKGIDYWASPSALRMTTAYCLLYALAILLAILTKEISAYFLWGLLVYVLSKLHMALRQPRWHLWESVRDMDPQLYESVVKESSQRPLHNLFSFSFNNNERKRAPMLQVLLSSEDKFADRRLSVYKRNYKLALLTSGLFLFLWFVALVVYVLRIGMKAA